MTAPAFDTLKAANALKAAGFDERQAEAVVTTIGGAVEESLVTKAHLGEALRQVVTVSGLDEALKEALEPMVTKAHLEERLNEALEPMVTKAHLAERLNEALEPMATKADLTQALEPMVTDTRLAEKLLEFEQRMTIRLGGLMAAGIGILALVVGLF